MVFLAGAPYYELVKEREGAPSLFPRCSRLFFSIFPSFSLAVLTQHLPARCEQGDRVQGVESVSEEGF